MEDARWSDFTFMDNICSVNRSDFTFLDNRD
jgi:hypothetical protein